MRQAKETVSWWWLSKKVRLIDNPLITSETLKEYPILPYKKEKDVQEDEEKTGNLRQRIIGKLHPMRIVDMAENDDPNA